eukprot:g42667.t1
MALTSIIMKCFERLVMAHTNSSLPTCLDPLQFPLLFLNVSKTKELIIDFRKKGGEHDPIYIFGTVVERVKSIKFLRVTITGDMSWTSHVDATVKRAQRLFFLRRLRKFGMSRRSLTNFYRCTIESTLSGCITAWCGNSSAQDCKKLQKVVCTAQTTETNLPSMDSKHAACCRGKAANIIKDPSHQNGCLSEVLDPGDFQGGLGITKGAKATLHVDQEAILRFYKACPMPFALWAKVQEEIRRLEIERVTKPVQFAEWAALVILIVKPDGLVHLCGDFKQTVNCFLQLDKYPICHMEVLFAKLAGGGVSIYLDDILKTGKTNKEHLEDLDVVLNHFSQVGIRPGKNVGS